MFAMHKHMKQVSCQKENKYRVGRNSQSNLRRNWASGNKESLNATSQHSLIAVGKRRVASHETPSSPHNGFRAKFRL